MLVNIGKKIAKANGDVLDDYGSEPLKSLSWVGAAMLAHKFDQYGSFSVEPLKVSR